MKTTVSKARLISASLFLLVGILTLWQSWSLPFGTIRAIKAGFFPQVFGALLVILSSAMLIQLFVTRNKNDSAESSADQSAGTPETISETENSEAADAIQIDTASAVEASVEDFASDDPFNTRGLILFTLICIAFVVVTHFAGFVIASMIAVGGMGYLLTLRGWRLILLTVLVSFVTWLIFDYWLGLSLPSGVWFT